MKEIRKILLFIIMILSLSSCLTVGKMDKIFGKWYVYKVDGYKRTDLCQTWIFTANSELYRRMEIDENLGGAKYTFIMNKDSIKFWPVGKQEEINRMRPFKVKSHINI
jgi:hypothetical protein